MMDFGIYSAPGHLLRRVSQIHDRVFEEEFGGRITPRQLALLITLDEHPGADQITLSSAIAVDRSTIGDMVSRLVERGLIERYRSPEDGRRNVLRVSKAGRRLLNEFLPRISVVDDRLLEPLSERERATLMRLLWKLATMEDPAFPEYRAYALQAEAQAKADAEKADRRDGSRKRAAG